MTTVILFVFGAIIGSFLNVVALRLNSGLSLSGRSHCPQCGKTLKYYELIPILSFFWFGGRCRECRVRISWQYPIVEILTGLLFLSLYCLPFTIYQRLILATVFCIYIVIVIYDLRHKIIPDSLVYVAILLSVVNGWFSAYRLLDWLAGPLLFGFFALIWLLSRGRAIGFGDAKLVLSVGLLLGAALGFSAIILAFWMGAGIGLALLVYSRVVPLFVDGKKITIKSEIPFAPFIILGAWLATILNLDLTYVSLLS